MYENIDMFSQFVDKDWKKYQVQQKEHSVNKKNMRMLEKLMKKRIVHFLESNNLLSDTQYGFRNDESFTIV